MASPPSTDRRKSQDPTNLSVEERNNIRRMSRLADPEQEGEKGIMASIRRPWLDGETSQYIQDRMNSYTNQTIITIMIFFALFGDDFRLYACPLTYYSDDGDFSSDDVFIIITILCLIVFTAELIVNYVTLPEWRLGFYFWLDLLADISLIFDITWFTDTFTDDQTLVERYYEPQDGSGSGPSSGNEQGAVSEVKAARASRAGTKAGRIVRIVRLIRLVRLVKLYKQREKLKGNDVVDVNMPVLEAEPSKVGKKLTELTTIRTIILILLMIVILPLIDSSSVVTLEGYEGQQNELDEVHRYRQDYNSMGFITDDFLKLRTQEFASHVGDLDGDLFPILNMEIYGVSGTEVEEWLLPERGSGVLNLRWKIDTEVMSISSVRETLHYIDRNFRKSEYVPLDASGCFNSSDTDSGSTIDFPVVSKVGVCQSRLIFSVARNQAILAGYNMLKTCFIMFLLGVAIIFITRDAETLVIVPIERMMLLVKRLADNPLGSTKVDDPFRDENDDKEADEEGYETRMLEQTLSKIGGLLQVGFGVAGSEIIGANMGAEGGLNVLIPGQKITTVVVFGIIEDFTETCSCLGVNICKYINTIANIVHGGAHNWFGAANKNIGSAFLLVWKLCNGHLPGLRDPRDGSNVARRPQAEIDAERKSMTVTSMGCRGATKAATLTVQNMVDASLIAVLKMCVELHNANKPNGALYNSFCRNPKMVETFGDNYAVGMGFGMHIGWAIEGAIGSKYKVDASYLSPNVNMAARLEAATHMYGVHILLSEWFVHELSKPCVKHCRRLDKVTVKGSQVPMEMWTFDITSFPDKFMEPLLDSSGMQTMPTIDAEGSIFAPLKLYQNPDFVQLYDDGVAAYLAGNWSEAKSCLEKANALKDDCDKPCQLLLRVMGSKNFKAPETWKGFRELTSKT